MSNVQGSTDTASDRPEPRSVEEAFRRMNRSVEQVSETARAILHHPKLEYDQGDGLSMEYDDAHDLAAAFFALLHVCREDRRRALEEAQQENARLRTINHELVCSHNDLLVVIARLEDAAAALAPSTGEVDDG